MDTHLVKLCLPPRTAVTLRTGFATTPACLAGRGKTIVGIQVQRLRNFALSPDGDWLIAGAHQFGPLLHLKGMVTWVRIASITSCI